MTDSSKIPNIHGPKSGQESSSEKNIDPEKFKRINQVDESDETHKRHNRNLKKEEEEEEEEKVSGDAPEGTTFGELMNGKKKLRSIYDIDKSKNPPVTKKASLGSSNPAPPSQMPHLGNAPHPSLQHEQDDRFYISTGSPTAQPPEREKPKERIPHGTKSIP